jgi:hypothetical protein
VVDCKVNEHTVNEKQPDGTRKPVFYESSPRLRNLAAITAAELPSTAIIRREARRSAIAHNKLVKSLMHGGRSAGTSTLVTGPVGHVDRGCAGAGEALPGHLRGRLRPSQPICCPTPD